MKTSIITQITLLTNVPVTYLVSNEATVTTQNIILSNFITTSNEVTNLVINPLSNSQPQQSNKAHLELMNEVLLTSFFLLNARFTHCPTMRSCHMIRW